MGPLKAGEEVNFMVWMGEDGLHRKGNFPLSPGLWWWCHPRMQTGFYSFQSISHSLVYVSLTTTGKMGCFIPEKQNSKLRIKRIQWLYKMTELKMGSEHPLTPVFQLNPSLYLLLPPQEPCGFSSGCSCRDRFPVSLYIALYSAHLSSGVLSCQIGKAAFITPQGLCWAVSS